MPKRKATKEYIADAWDDETHSYSTEHEPESRRNKGRRRRARNRNLQHDGDEKATISHKNKKRTHKLEDHKVAYENEEEDKAEAVLAAKTAENDEEEIN